MNSANTHADCFGGASARQTGDDLAALLQAALQRANIVLKDGDILVIAQKIVSKAEGRIINLNEVVPSLASISSGEGSR